MSLQMEYRAPNGQEEIDDLRDILCQAFSVPEKQWEPYLRRVGQGNFRILRSRDEIQGGLGILRMGQYFGGRSIPMAGIAAVGVSPHLRGYGVASDLMKRAIREIHQEGIPLSVLYAASVTLYRSSGYELAGSHIHYKLAPTALQVRDRDLEVRPADPLEDSGFRELARRRAEQTAGNIDRTPQMWANLTHTDGDPVYAYLIGPKDRPEGSIIFNHERAPGGYKVRVRDMVAMTPAAARRIWSFLASHAAQSPEIVWRGPAIEPLLWPLPEPRIKIVDGEYWMLRVVDVRRALELRGYPKDVDGEIHLEITDDLLETNNGRFVLRVADGEGTVTEGGDGDLRLDTRQLAPLFTGFLGTPQLASVTGIEADERVLHTATRIFSGPEPWMPDSF